jgi:hypothetical protein
MQALAAGASCEDWKTAFRGWNFKHFLVAQVAAGSKMVIFHARNTNLYKICELHMAMFSSFYNISQPNFAILLILTCPF